jgi:hypothetical protein
MSRKAEVASLSTLAAERGYRLVSCGDDVQIRSLRSGLPEVNEARSVLVFSLVEARLFLSGMSGVFPPHLRG